MTENVKKYYWFRAIQPDKEENRELSALLGAVEFLTKSLIERLQENGRQLVNGPNFWWRDAPPYGIEWSKEAAKEFYSLFPDGYIESEEWLKDPWFPEWKVHKLCMIWTEASNGVERPL